MRFDCPEPILSNIQWKRIFSGLLALYIYCGVHGVGYEAVLVGPVVQFIELLRSGSVGRIKLNPGAQGDRRHSHLASSISFEDTYGFIPVRIHHNTLFGGEGKEEQHVARGQGGDECLFRVHVSRF
jgi:hypothetical protein